MTAEKSPFSRYQQRDLAGHRNKAYSLGWNCSGRKLASGSWDNTARIWSVDPAGVRKDVAECELKGHTGQVEQLAWDPTQEARLATSSPDKTLRIWDARAGKEICKVTTSAVNLNLAWHPHGQHLALGNRDDTVVLLDLRRPNKPLRSHKHTCQVEEIAFSVSGKHFLQIMGDGCIEVYRFPTFERTTSVVGHTDNGYSLAIDPTDKYFASGGADGVVCLWDVGELACVRTYSRFDVPVRTISFSGDGRYLAVAPESEGAIDIEDVATGQRAHTIELRHAVDFVRWNPKALVLAYNGEHGHGFGLVSLFAPPLSR